ncbi:MAG: hypothetical protein Kow0047_28550 [Anaerolineae bacterium]
MCACMHMFAQPPPKSKPTSVMFARAFMNTKENKAREKPSSELSLALSHASDQITGMAWLSLDRADEQTPGDEPLQGDGHRDHG